VNRYEKSIFGSGWFKAADPKRRKIKIEWRAALLHPLLSYLPREARQSLSLSFSIPPYSLSLILFPS
jgi:hypothetical protein